MSPLANSQIHAIETELGHKLPGLYHTLLFEFGPGTFGECEIYHPLVIRELYEPFFDDPTLLFTRYFPFGCQNVRQELWVIETALEMAATIGHETVPDDWPEEYWLPYESWIERNLESESELKRLQRPAR